MAEFKKVTDEFKSTVETDLSSIEHEFKDVNKDLKEAASEAEIQDVSQTAPPEPRPFANPFMASGSSAEDMSSQAEIQDASQTAPSEPRPFANPFMASGSSVEDMEKGKEKTAEIPESAPSTIPAAQITSPPKEEGPPAPTKEPV